MTSLQMDRLSHFITGISGLLAGLLGTALLVGWRPGHLLWPGLLLFVPLLYVQQKMARNTRRKIQQEEANALERLVDLKREVDRTARRYRALLEGAGTAIFVFDADSARLLEVNRKGMELFGYSKQEILSLAGKDLTPSFERRRFSDLVRRVKRRGRGRTEAITFLRKEGDVFLGEVQARLIDLDNEKVVHATVIDITIKNRTEKEIKQRNSELSILNTIIARASESLKLESVLEIILMETIKAFGADAGMIHLVQPEGGSMALAVKQNLQDALVSKIERHSCKSYDHYYCNNVSGNQSKKCLISSAVLEAGWLSMASVPLISKQKLVGLLHILSSAERSYTADEIRFFETLGNQIGIIVEHAGIFAELSWKTDELTRSYGLLEKSSRQVALSQRRLNMNLALVERANKELARLDRMKNHFLGIVSHEFKTPLTSILGGTDFLLASCANWTEEEKRLLSIIHEGGIRLNDIVSNLLKVARLEAKSTSPTKSPLDLNLLLTDIHSQLIPILSERGQELVLRELDSIPCIAADRGYLEEVFAQLLENAIKFSQDGEQIVVTAKLIDRDELESKREVISIFNENFLERVDIINFILLEIRDSGIGIDSDEHLLIFDKFYSVGDVRNHSSGRSKFQGKGPGLGLTIVKGMVEAHGGMVWVESPRQDPSENPGSSFFVLLPTEETDQQPAFPFMHSSGHEPLDEDVLPMLKVR